MRDEDFARLESALLSLSRQSATAAILAGPEQLDRSAYIIMARLFDAGPQSIGQLADAFGLDVSTINRQTAAVVRTELVERIADPDGGMARKFVLTDAGRQRFVEHRDWNDRGLRAVLADWNGRDVERLAALLERFSSDIDHYRRDHPRTSD